jgi:hypothetical protein
VPSSASSIGISANLFRPTSSGDRPKAFTYVLYSICTEAIRSAVTENTGSVLVHVHAVLHVTSFISQSVLTDHKSVFMFMQDLRVLRR